MSKKCTKTQDDLLYVSKRFSIERDKYQWLLYDYEKSRYKENGDLKTYNNAYITYHPHLKQLVDSMVERVPQDAKVLSEIESLINTHKYQIYDFMKKATEPWGKTPAETAVEAHESNS